MNEPTATDPIAGTTQPAERPLDETPPQQHGSGAEAPASDQHDTPAPKIERVIDVPLAVTLRFGQRHLTLREVLALSTGSLVELDRQVEEPVDLVLGDRLIARGEVVIVDGNYGLRVTDVVEGAAQRIHRLHADARPDASHSELEPA